MYTFALTCTVAFLLVAVVTSAMERQVATFVAALLFACSSVGILPSEPKAWSVGLLIAVIVIAVALVIWSLRRELSDWQQELSSFDEF